MTARDLLWILCYLKRSNSEGTVEYFSAASRQILRRPPELKVRLHQPMQKYPGCYAEFEFRVAHLRRGSGCPRHRSMHQIWTTLLHNGPDCLGLWTGRQN